MVCSSVPFSTHALALKAQYNKTNAHNIRLLRLHVYRLLDAVLSRPSRCLWERLGRAGVYAIRPVFRLHGWEGGAVEA